MQLLTFMRKMIGEILSGSSSSNKLLYYRIIYRLQKKTETLMSITRDNNSKQSAVCSTLNGTENVISSTYHMQITNGAL